MAKRLLKKLLLIGGAGDGPDVTGVGKTSLTMAWTRRPVSTRYRATIGADFVTKDLNDSTTLQIWDTAGIDRFSSLGTAFYRGTDYVMFVVDVTQPSSFEEMKSKWMPDLVKIIGENAFKNLHQAIVVTKMDCDTGKLKLSDVKAFAARNKMGYYETSALNKEGCDDALEGVHNNLGSGGNFPTMTEDEVKEGMSKFAYEDGRLAWSSKDEQEAFAAFCLKCGSGVRGGLPPMQFTHQVLNPSQSSAAEQRKQILWSRSVGIRFTSATIGMLAELETLLWSTNISAVEFRLLSYDGSMLSSDTLDAFVRFVKERWLDVVGCSLDAILFSNDVPKPEDISRIVVPLGSAIKRVVFLVPSKVVEADVVPLFVAAAKCEGLKNILIAEPYGDGEHACHWSSEAVVELMELQADSEANDPLLPADTILQTSYGKVVKSEFDRWMQEVRSLDIPDILEATPTSVDANGRSIALLVGDKVMAKLPRDVALASSLLLKDMVGEDDGAAEVSVPLTLSKISGLTPHTFQFLVYVLTNCFKQREVEEANTLLDDSPPLLRPQQFRVVMMMLYALINSDSEGNDVEDPFFAILFELLDVAIYLNIPCLKRMLRSAIMQLVSQMD